MLEGPCFAPDHVQSFHFIWSVALALYPAMINFPIQTLKMSLFIKLPPHSQTSSFPSHLNSIYQICVQTS